MLFGLLSTKAQFDGDDTEYIEDELDFEPEYLDQSSIFGLNILRII